MSELQRSLKTAVNFEGEDLSVEEIRNLESNILRRVAMRFLTPEERAAVVEPEEGGGARSMARHADEAYDYSRHDSDPHDSDPHDSDVHDRDNFDRDNFDRV